VRYPSSGRTQSRVAQVDVGSANPDCRKGLGGLESPKRAHFSSLPLLGGPVNIDLIDARMLAPLVGFLDRNGGRSEAFLDRRHIPGELITAGGWITKKQAYDFTCDVVRRSCCPDTVFAAYLHFEFKHLGPIEAAMKSCKTVKESLELGARLGSAAYERNEYFLKIEGDTTWFCYREPSVGSPGQTYINDMTLMVYYRLIRALVDEDWRPERILIRGQPTDRHRTVEGFEDCRADQHADHIALGFPTAFLSRRLVSFHPEYKVDERHLWLSGPEVSPPIVDSIYRLVASRFTYRKLPTLDHVALMVGVSPATLKRNLHSAGMTYSRLLDRMRFDAAREMLSIPQASVKEIAHELAYSGANSFVRSFRRMTGVTPGEYRQREFVDNGES
jgi:AraC-like DNA-binding protein